MTEERLFTERHMKEATNNGFRIGVQYAETMLRQAAEKFPANRSLLMALAEGFEEIKGKPLLDLPPA